MRTTRLKSRRKKRKPPPTPATEMTRNTRRTRVTRNKLASFLMISCAFCAFCVPYVVAQLPMQPILDSGASVTGAFEGWYKNNDGTYCILVGYLNRNQKQVLDIPVGQDNHIEPVGPDQGQPTHFLPRR